MSVLQRLTGNLLALARTAQHRTDLENVPNWRDFLQIVFGRSAAGMRPRAQRHTVSVRVKEGALHPSAKMTHRQCRGAKATALPHSLCPSGEG